MNHDEKSDGKDESTKTEPEKIESLEDDPARAKPKKIDGLEEETAPETKKKRKPLEIFLSQLKDLAVVVGSALIILFLINNFLIHTYIVPSQSMENTLIGCPGCVDDRIVVDRVTYKFRSPHPGDVIVFKAPSPDWIGEFSSSTLRSSNTAVRGIQNFLSIFGLQPPDEYDLVKRVIAVGGQTIECRNSNGGVTVDGKLIYEPYLSPQSKDAMSSMGPCLGQEFGPVTVPKGNVFVMGDNRIDSADSRYHINDPLQGTVPSKDIRGIVRFIIYPFNRIGGVGQINPQTTKPPAGYMPPKLIQTTKTPTTPIVPANPVATQTPAKPAK